MYKKGLSKKDAIKVVKELTKKYEKQYTDIYISKNPCKISTIKDATGKSVFKASHSDKGWLVFIDPFNMKNWSHQCEYLFIVDQDEIIQNRNAKYMPTEKLQLERLLESDEEE